MGATLRASRTAGIAGAALIAAAAIWTGVPTTDGLPSAAQGDADGDLVDRFLTVAEAVPFVNGTDVLVAELTVEAEFLGDFIGDHRALEAVSEDAQALFITGDDARSDLGDLVAEGARAVMLIEDGYRRLADYELIVPFESRDDLDVAVGTDEPRHLLRQGVDLVQQGHYRLEDVLVAMTALDLTADQADRYQDIVEREVVFAVEADPALRMLMAEPTSLEMVGVTRFQADIAGTAVARWAEYLCVPRGAANALSLQAMLTAITTNLGTSIADDCPNLPDPEVLTPGEAGVDLTQNDAS